MGATKQQERQRYLWIDQELTRLEAIEVAARAYIQAYEYWTVQHEIVVAYFALKAALEAGDAKRD